MANNMNKVLNSGEAMQETQTPSLMDRSRRPINYLRISVTDRCNLRCRYCAPAEPKRIERENLLTLEEIHRLVRIAAGLGINKIRLTGGEPLVRKGITELIERLGRIEEIHDIALTTNGTLLSQFGRQLREAGLKRLNISLDTLDPARFRTMTGFDRFDKVWQGILLSEELGFHPIKINTVVMKGFNDDEVQKLAALTLKYPFHIRFIEYMPIGTRPDQAHQYSVSIAQIRNELEKTGKLLPVQHTRGDGPAVRFRYEGAPGEIGLIGSMTAHFCSQCNRLRLTSTGHLRPCLLSDDQVNVIDALRRGAGDDEIRQIFLDVVARKRPEHGLSFQCGQALQSQMVSIGG